jgi:hypothetical protein
MQSLRIPTPGDAEMKKNDTKKRSLPARMKSNDPEIEHAFSRVVGAFVDDNRVVYGGGKGFGSKALKIDGKLFAMVSAKGKFVAKLPAHRVDDLVRQGIGEYFTSGGERSMKEWLALDGDYSIWITLAKEARAFVASVASGNEIQVSKKTRRKIRSPIGRTT